MVLTPSDDLAEKIKSDVTKSLGFPTFDAGDIEGSRSAFTDNSPAVALVANRYDGIDFPDDDCRLMFIEGLPRATNLQERFLMNRMGANLLFNERVQTRVLQAIGRCTRGLNDYSAVVVTGEDLPAYLTDRDRRAYLHPELQAELKFGIEQSTGTDIENLRENFDVFLEHDAEWESANEQILEARAVAEQIPFPAMNELAASVIHEIAYQKAMWDKDYPKAYEGAREVLGELRAPGLRGYRALWHYLAGSAAELAAADGSDSFETQARTHFKNAKEAATGIPWLVSLSHRSTPTLTPEERNEATTMLQVERLEAMLLKLGTLHNRTFSAREKEIRSGLQNGATFEQAQVLLGEHLGLIAGKKETDASPDPWWMIGNIAFVFEDHANAAESAVIDATKARQASSHPRWLKEHVPETEDKDIYSILVTPAKKAKSGAIPHLTDVCHWDLSEFRTWAEQALAVIRELRHGFTLPGDLAWRALAASALAEARIDAPSLAIWLKTRSARDHLHAID